MFEQGRELKPIQYPKRPQIAIRGRPDGRRANLAPDKYVDRRRQGLKHVRFDFQADLNVLNEREDYEVVSPDSFNLEIDSANDQKQVYYLPGYNQNGCQLLRPIVDTVNNLYITYHYDRRNQRWVKMITRLRKDLTYPEPPVGYNYNYQQYYGSRGTRYVRYRKELSKDFERRRSLANRLYYGNRAGTSGARYSLGPFSTGSR